MTTTRLSRREVIVAASLIGAGALASGALAQTGKPGADGRALGEGEKSMAAERVCLITGAYKGMGFEAARQIGKKGIHVMPSARYLEQTARDAFTTGVQATAILGAVVAGGAALLALLGRSGPRCPDSDACAG